MHPTKALEVDGFHALFYQKYHRCVGRDVVQIVWVFLNGTLNSRSSKKLFYSFDPEVENPKKISEHRPINHSLQCGIQTDFKNSNKIDCVRCVLSEVIDDSRSAFVNRDINYEQCNTWYRSFSFNESEQAFPDRGLYESKN